MASSSVIFCRVSTFLTGAHCKLRPNTEGPVWALAAMDNEMYVRLVLTNLLSDNVCCVLQLDFYTHDYAHTFCAVSCTLCMPALQLHTPQVIQRFVRSDNQGMGDLCRFI
jgi:hypothetical protein